MFPSGSGQDVRMGTKKPNVEIGRRCRIMGKEAYLPDRLYSLWHNHASNERSLHLSYIAEKHEFHQGLINRIKHGNQDAEFS